MEKERTMVGMIVAKATNLIVLYIFIQFVPRRDLFEDFVEDYDSDVMFLFFTIQQIDDETEIMRWWKTRFLFCSSKHFGKMSRWLCNYLT